MSDQVITDTDVKQVLHAAAVLTALSELMSQDPQTDPGHQQYVDGLGHCADQLRACVGQHRFSADGHWRTALLDQHVKQLGGWHTATR